LACFNTTENSGGFKWFQKNRSAHGSLANQNLQKRVINRPIMTLICERFAPFSSKSLSQKKKVIDLETVVTAVAFFFGAFYY
jgi:hypothetical protein